MVVQISLAQHDDVAPWLRLAEDVVLLFGPMPDFDAVLVRKIAQQRAFRRKNRHRKRRIHWRSSDRWQRLETRDPLACGLFGVSKVWRR
ncbi:hypothetical protein ACVIGV_004846 [Rhizobium leguminosarum]